MIVAKSWDPIAMKWSKHGLSAYPYSVKGAVLIAEVTKFVISAIALAVQLSWEPDPKARARLLAFQWRSNIHMAVPALLYAVANYLSFLLAGTVDPGVYQTLGQLKIVTTAVLFRIMLHRPQTRSQWYAVCILLLGAAMASNASTSSGLQSFSHVGSLSFGGLVLGGAQATCGSLANVYSEKLFKKTEGNSIFFQNMQLYAYGMLVLASTMWFYDGEKLHTHGFWHNWDALTWLAVFSLALFGLACAFVFKYLDVSDSRPSLIRSINSLFGSSCAPPQAYVHVPTAHCIPRRPARHCAHAQSVTWLLRLCACAHACAYVQNMFYVHAGVVCIFVSAVGDWLAFGNYPGMLLLPSALIVGYAVRMYYQKPKEPDITVDVTPPDAAEQAS